MHCLQLPFSNSLRALKYRVAKPPRPSYFKGWSGLQNTSRRVRSSVQAASRHKHFGRAIAYEVLRSPIPASFSGTKTKEAVTENTWSNAYIYTPALRWSARSLLTLLRAWMYAKKRSLATLSDCTAPRSSGIADSNNRDGSIFARMHGCRLTISRVTPCRSDRPAVRGFGGVLKEFRLRAAKNAPENAAKTLGTGLGNSGQLLEVVLLHMRVKASECG
ncbi:hypothetical protein L1887_55310 [Cichorium endivia]|nr:hypothetical protein L1887_55310 [Cichorium endivia]